MEREKIIKEIKNLLFKSKEEPNTIEHVDMKYTKFIALIQKLSDTAYQEGREDGYEDGSYNCSCHYD